MGQIDKSAAFRSDSGALILIHLHETFQFSLNLFRKLNSIQSWPNIFFLIQHKIFIHNSLLFVHGSSLCEIIC